MDSESEESDVGKYISLYHWWLFYEILGFNIVLCLIFLKSKQKLTEKDVLNQTTMNPRKWETQALR